MKKLLCIIFILFLSSISTFASEDIILDANVQETTLTDKIHEILTSEVEDTNRSFYLFEDILTKKFETGPVETMNLFGYYRGYVEMDLSEGGDSEYESNAVQVGLKGKFRGSETFYETRFRFNPVSEYSFLQCLPVENYIANKSIPHHTIFLGNMRTPTGYEGGATNTVLPFLARSQIARNFGNTRKVGLKVKGNYDLIEYDIGGYSSETYFKSFFPGTEFSGWLTLKPLGKTDGKYGKLNLAGGVTAGRYNTDYTVSGLYASYEYKKFMANFEYAYADGYNGAHKVSTNKAEGFYSTLSYKITPKLHLLGRYDQYIPNKAVQNNTNREYSAGLSYFVKGQALKVMLNYVFCQNDAKKDSHRIMLGTQILL